MHYQEFAVTAEDVKRIEQAEQRSDAWKAARKWRLTGSNFGAAAGHNPYKSPEGLVVDMLWGNFTGNAATEWGTQYEPVACAMYEARMRQQWPDFVVQHKGLIVIPDTPFIGVSPDGLCRYWDAAAGHYVTFLLEIKCPFRWKQDKFYDGHVPTYYYDQIQGIMGFLGLPFCDFVVWTPAGMEINRVQYDPAYFCDVLKPLLLAWYEKLFYPKLCGWREGRIKPPALEEEWEVDLGPTVLPVLATQQGS